MDFTDTGINSSNTLVSSYQDVNLRRQQGYYSSLDYDLLRLRSQIFEAVYRKTDLIRANHELSHDRDALKRRNRELEAGFSESEMTREEIKRDLEVSRERVSELEGETKEKSRILSEIVQSARSVDDRLSKSIGETEEHNNSRTVLELVKEVKAKVETVMESMEKNKMELSTSVELLEDENRDMSVLLRAALSEKHTAEKQLKETSEQKRWALMQIAERGLQRIGFGFGARESVQEISEMQNLGNDDESEEGEQNGVVCPYFLSSHSCDYEFFSNKESNKGLIYMRRTGYSNREDNKESTQRDFSAEAFIGGIKVSFFVFSLTQNIDDDGLWLKLGFLWTPKRNN